MNPTNAIKIQQSSQPNPANSITVESVELSTQNLIKNWYNRQKWRHYLFNPPKNDDVLINAKPPWRSHLANFLESNPIHIITILLLIIDLIFTILELSSSLLSCTPEKKQRKNIEKIWYHWGGIAILSLLSAKSMALAVGQGSAFFRRPGYVVDGAVVIAALILEAFLERKGGGLLVVVSLWRVVRVVESAFELSDEAIEAQIEGIVCQFEALRDENTRLLDTIADQGNIIEKLSEELEKYRHAYDNIV